MRGASAHFFVGYGSKNTPMTNKTKATLNDWAWVEMMIFQALFGLLTPHVRGIQLSETEQEWILSFFAPGEFSEDLREDLEFAVDQAMSFLNQKPTEKTHTTSAIFKPINAVFSNATMDRHWDHSTRPLFAWDPEVE